MRYFLFKPKKFQKLFETEKKLSSVFEYYRDMKEDIVFKVDENDDIFMMLYNILSDEILPFIRCKMYNKKDGEILKASELYVPISLDIHKEININKNSIEYDSNMPYKHGLIECPSIDEDNSNNYLRLNFQYNDKDDYFYIYLNDIYTIFEEIDKTEFMKIETKKNFM